VAYNATCKQLEAAEKKAAEWAGWCESHKIAIDVYATDNAVLRKRLEAAECPDVLTAHALAELILANKVPSPWRDTGTRLRAFGKWLAALAEEEKP
jgi:hypothetical protein